MEKQLEHGKRDQQLQCRQPECYRPTQYIACHRKQNQVNRSQDRKSTRLNSSHLVISYAVFCLKKKNKSSHAFSFSRIWNYTACPTSAMWLISLDPKSQSTPASLRVRIDPRSSACFRSVLPLLV